MQLAPDDLGTGPVAAVARELYEVTTRRPMRHTWARAPYTLAPYLDWLYTQLGQSVPEVHRWYDDEPQRLADTGSLLVGFSGGKDSLATALLAQRDGWQVTLVHVLGLNRAWPDEVRFARQCAALVGLPLVELTVHPSGTKEGVPEPVAKNQIIVAGMVQWALANDQGPAFSMGMVRGDTVDHAHPLSYLHDTDDAHQLFGRWLESAAPGYQGPLYLRGVTESTAVVAGYPDRRLLWAAHGCMAQMRFRPGYRQRAEAKYGVRVLPGRCGVSCQKCANEYIILWDLGALEPEEMSEGVYLAARSYLGRRPLYDAATRPDLAALTFDQLADRYREPDLLEEYRRPVGQWPKAVE